MGFDDVRNGSKSHREQETLRRKWIAKAPGAHSCDEVHETSRPKFSGSAVAVNSLLLKQRGRSRDQTCQV